MNFAFFAAMMAVVVGLACAIIYQSEQDEQQKIAAIAAGCHTRGLDARRLGWTSIVCADAEGRIYFPRAPQ